MFYNTPEQDPRNQIQSLKQFFFYSSYIKTEPGVFNDNSDTLLTVKGTGNVKSKKGKKMKRNNLLGTVSIYFLLFHLEAKPLIETKTNGEITAGIFLHVTGS